MISGIIRAKSAIDYVTDYASDGLLRTEQKRKREQGIEDAAAKRAKNDPGLKVVPNNDGHITFKDFLQRRAPNDVTGDGSVTRVGFDNMADHIETEPALTEPGTGGGANIILGDTRQTTGDSAGVREYTFSRTFNHYLDGSERPFSTIEIHALQNDHYTRRCDFKYAWMDIPYYTLGAAMKDAEIQTTFINATVWRVTSCGFKMSNIIPLVDTVETQGGQLSLGLAANTRPYIMATVDSRRHFFGNTSDMCTPLPNNEMIYNIPETRKIGSLKFINEERWFGMEWVKQNAYVVDKELPTKKALTISMDQWQSIMNTDDLQYIRIHTLQRQSLLVQQHEHEHRG